MANLFPSIFPYADSPEMKKLGIQTEFEVYTKLGSIYDETVDILCEPKFIKRDYFGRTLAECFVNGESLSSFLVRHGYAFAYRKYSKKFVKDEEHAKKIKIGMWAMKFEFPWDFRKNKIADNPSERCGVELTAKLEGYMVWLTEELPHIEPAINLNCKIHIMNLKELTEKDKEKLKRHEIELSDENNKIV